MKLLSAIKKKLAYNDVLQKANILLSVTFILCAVLSCDYNSGPNVTRNPYYLKGKITSAKTSLPVKSVVVRISATYSVWDSTRTDTKGNYYIEKYVNSGYSNYQLNYHVEDTDGDINGTFEPLDTTITLKGYSQYGNNITVDLKINER